VAAALATYEGKEAITCILGTGSNSCYFDGSKVSEAIPNLGYILGDEGSGGYFGKKLLALYLYKKLPPHLQKAFEETYPIGKLEIFENVYRKPNPNTYIASFFRFVVRHREDPFFQQMVGEGLREFLKIHVRCFDNFKAVQVHFIGSVAFYFEATLKATAAKMGIEVGKIIQRPIDGLTEYYVGKGKL
jgi:hypothetical protein